MSGYTIEVLPIKDIYALLVDHNVLMGSDNVTIPLHCESKLPWLDWPQAWSRIRLRGLDPEAAATSFKIMHDILPTKYKVDQMSKNNDPLQGRCTFCPLLKDDIIHALSLCTRSHEAAQCLLKIIKKINVNITLVDAIYYQGDFGNRPLAMSWIISTSFHLIWSSRQLGGISAPKLMAELSARVEILSKTKYFEDYLIIHRALHQSV